MTIGNVIAVARIKPFTKSAVWTNWNRALCWDAVL